jgi:hypothetical protein
MGRKPWWLAMMAVSVVLGCQNSSGSRRANPPAPNLSANPNPSPSTSVPRNGNAYPTTSGWNDRLPGYTAQPTSVPGTLPPNPNNPAAPVNPGVYPPVPGNPSSYPAPGGTPIQRSNYNQPTGSAPGANFPRSDASMFPSSASNVRSFSSPDTAANRAPRRLTEIAQAADRFPPASTPIPFLYRHCRNVWQRNLLAGMTKPNGDTQMPDKYVRTTIPMVPPPPASAGTAPHVGGAESPGSQSPSGSSSRAPNNPPESLAVPPPPVPNSSGNAEPVFPSSPPPPPVH